VTGTWKQIGEMTTLLHKNEMKFFMVTEYEVQNYAPFQQLAFLKHVSYNEAESMTIPLSYFYQMYIYSNTGCNEDLGVLSPQNGRIHANV
jgi:hypothetical protein